MFVATKKQAKEIVSDCAKRINMPYVTERWLGGMLTNFNTVRKSVKKMQSIEKMLNDGSIDNLTKKERLTLTLDKDKMEKVLGGIAQISRVPAALFLVDIGHEHIALAEAKAARFEQKADSSDDRNKRARGAAPTKRRVPGPGAGGRRPATGGGSGGPR